MDKKEMISNNFKDYLFSQLDVEYVTEKVNYLLPILFAFEEYLKNDEKLFKVDKELLSILNEKQKKLFKEYQIILSDSLA